ASWSAGGSCAIVLRDPGDAETAARVEELFRRVLERPDSPILKILGRAELDRLGAIPRAAFMLEAADGHSFDERWIGPELHDSGDDYRGTHGYLPTRAEMRSAFIAYGPGVRRGARKDLVRMIDVAPTAAALMQMRLPEAEGEPVGEFLDG